MGKGGDMSTRTLVTGFLSAVFVTASVLGVLLLAHRTAPSANADVTVVDEIVAKSSSSAALAASAFGVGEARSSARRILAAWDRKRAAAYSGGDAASLRSLYAQGSRSGAADVALLEDYLDRGLHVEHLRMQMLSFRVESRTSKRLVVDVTDRLEGAVAVQGEQRTTLPKDRADQRRITLVRRSGSWLVSEVR